MNGEAKTFYMPLLCSNAEGWGVSTTDEQPEECETVEEAIDYLERNIKGYDFRGGFVFECRPIIKATRGKLKIQQLGPKIASGGKVK